MQASTLVIFGATGDLTHRKLIPALYHLFIQDKLPKDFQIVGFARREQSKELFQKGLKLALDQYNPDTDLDNWQDFASRLHYLKGELEEVGDYVKLAEYLKQFDPPGSCTNKIFYMATSPNFFTEIIENLESSQVFELLGDCWKRIIIEKPFGSDLESAKALNKLIDSKFNEKEIYRIDHYLAKETVQNIIAFRFENGSLENYWNKDYIDHIQITVSEEIGVENRGGYYDQAGNLRDIVQNHLLQLVALITMAKPSNFDSESIRDRRYEAIEALVPIDTDFSQKVVLGQYEGYRTEDKVLPGSQTDTYSGLEVYSSLESFKNVPILLRSGKKLPKREANIVVYFKVSEIDALPNMVEFQIQPEQKILIRNTSSENQLVSKEIDLRSNEKNGDAYEKVLLDIINGVQTFFPRADEVEASWKFIDPIIKNRDQIPLYFYKPGTWGPQESKKLFPD